MAITSMVQLQKLLESRTQVALSKTQKEIYDVINKHIAMYYKEKAFRKRTSDVPKEYVRTKRFLRSLIKTKLVLSRSGVACNVQINPKYLNYRYKGNPKWKDNVPATGRDVVSWANETSHDYTHGYTVSGFSSWWDDAMQELGGRQGIYNIIKKNLKAVGIPLNK